MKKSLILTLMLGAGLVAAPVAARADNATTISTMNAISSAISTASPQLQQQQQPSFRYQGPNQPQYYANPQLVPRAQQVINQIPNTTNYYHNGYNAQNVQQQLGNAAGTAIQQRYPTVGNIPAGQIHNYGQALSNGQVMPSVGSQLQPVINQHLPQGVSVDPCDCFRPITNKKSPEKSGLLF